MEPVTLIGLGVLIVSNVGLWIDKVYEGKRAVKNTQKNGYSLNGLHIKIDAITTAVNMAATNAAIAATKIESMQQLCSETRDRYEKKFDQIEHP